MKPRDWNRILAGLTFAAPIPLIARAETYLSESQAALAIFPGSRLAPQTVDLNPEQMKKIAKKSGERVRSSKIRIWRGAEGEAMIIDDVLGKHDMITYAVGIDRDGKVRGVEILAYRETYGYEVRRLDWRKQFAGKSLADPLQVDKDIQNISGATLSSVHVTNGVRRVLATYAILNGKA